MMEYVALIIIAVFGLLLSTLLLYLKLAPKWGLFDTPNFRSSHVQPTIRGAGIVYPVALILFGLIMGFQPTSVILGGILLGIISFVDDWKNLSASLRLFLHTSIIIWCLYDFSVEDRIIWIMPIAIFFYLWLMNAYNFMDGINGLTALNTLSILASLFILNSSTWFTSSFLLLVLTLATVIFTFFNLRQKAICFLGDVGSIPLGFVLIAITFSATFAMGDSNPFVFFAVYMIDSGWTILQRLLAKENILKPHRKHLYQVLVNEKGLPHVSVSLAYFLIQMAINMGYFLVEWPKHLYLLATVVILSVCYLIIKRKLLAK